MTQFQFHSVLNHNINIENLVNNFLKCFMNIANIFKETDNELNLMRNIYYLHHMNQIIFFI